MNKAASCSLISEPGLSVSTNIQAIPTLEIFGRIFVLAYSFDFIVFFRFTLCVCVLLTSSSPRQLPHNLQPLTSQPPNLSASNFKPHLHPHNPRRRQTHHQPLIANNILDRKKNKKISLSTVSNLIQLERHLLTVLFPPLSYEKPCPSFRSELATFNQSSIFFHL